VRLIDRAMLGEGNSTEGSASQRPIARDGYISRSKTVFNFPSRGRQTQTRLSVTNILCASLLACWMAQPAAAGERKYDPGASDTEIRIGNTMPYSGQASAWGLIGRAEAAYFEKVNAEGGINGRKIKFISYDDAYSPPKTVEQTRRLIG
jgi:ABC-type branched-subunit amino acid transport system substrate-binding protein